MSNVSQPDLVHVHDINNTDYDNGNVVVTNVSPPDLLYVDDVFNTEHDNDNRNDLVSTPSPPGLGQDDNISNTNYDDNDNAVVPDVCPQDDRSTLDGEKLNDIPDFLYQLKYKERHIQPIRTFGNRCLSAIGGGNQWSRFAGWVQLSAEAAWPPQSTARATLCAQTPRRNAGNLAK